MGASRLGAVLLLSSVASGSCTAGGGEGERCDHSRGNDDCGVGLVCTSHGEVAALHSVCCPPRPKKPTVEACRSVDRAAPPDPAIDASYVADGPAPPLAGGAAGAAGSRGGSSGGGIAGAAAEGGGGVTAEGGPEGGAVDAATDTAGG